MIVPRFWAEARLQERTRSRQVTLYRFGWSNESAADAQRMADQRVGEAMARVNAGERLDQREPKVPYNGADGIPIREEVLATHGETVITRNSYGARCLNTPDVLLADVDFEQGTSTGRLELATTLGAMAVLIGLWVATGSFGQAASITLGLLVVAAGAFHLFKRARVALSGGDEQFALKRVRVFAQQHPDWRVHVYRTPAGLRLLAGHRRFDPVEPAVRDFFTAVQVDPMYARMCTLQRCFRARLTAKPWRIGVASHLKPRPGVWPVNPARLPERTRWIDAYEQQATGYAACRFLETIGTGPADREVEAVRSIHDEACRARSQLPLA